MKQCDYGCENIAKFQFGNGKWCCSKSRNQCPEVKRLNSEAQKLSWTKERKIPTSPIWNKGKTKETSDSVKRGAETLKAKIANGTLKNGFKGKHHTEESKRKQGKSFVGKIPQNLFDVSLRTLQKIMKRLNVKCFSCNWANGTCDIHHIIPKSDGGSNEHSNLTILCPNCHRLAHENKLTDMISFDKVYGEEWRKMYYSHK